MTPLAGVTLVFAWLALLLAFLLQRALAESRATKAKTSKALMDGVILQARLDQSHMDAATADAEWARLYSIAQITVDEQRAEINRLTAKAPTGWTVHDTTGSYR